MKRWLLGGISVGAVVLVGVLLVLDNHSPEIVPPIPTFDPATYIATLRGTTTNPLLVLETEIVDIMANHGVDAGFAIVREAEAQQIIDNDGCHAILHYVGHAAYNTYRDDFAAITAPVEGTKCIGGYVHGVEAEILLASDNPIEDIKRFCAYTNERNLTPTYCYHGVGHAAAELYDYNPHQALATCDALLGGPEDNLRNCYRGVFSEIGNVILGVDGHTGRERDRVAVFGLDPQEPYTWCNTFGEQYQSSCKSQLTKLLTTELNMSDWLLPCLENSLTTADQNICVNIVIANYVRGQLSFSISTSLPTQVNELPLEQQHIAILGALESFSGYQTDKKERSWEPICSSFLNSSIASACAEMFTAYIQQDIAPWEEAQNIR